MTAQGASANVLVEPIERGVGGVLARVDVAVELRVVPGDVTLATAESSTKNVVDLRPGVAREHTTLVNEDLRALADLSSSPDWGGDDEEQIAAADWQWAERFAQHVADHQPPLPAPSFAPCGDGSVHLTWFGPGPSRFVIEHKGALTCYSSCDAAGRYETDVVSNDSAALKRLIAFLK